MIVTGYTKSPKKTTNEIIDVINGETCADLADFPMEIGCSVDVNLQHLLSAEVTRIVMEIQIP